MKTSVLKIILLIFFSGSCSFIYGQDTTMLSEELYKIQVLENNYRILAAMADVEAANSQIEVSKRDLYPSLDFVGSNLYFDDRVTPEGFPALRKNFFSLGVQLSQNIYSGGLVQKNKRLAEIYAEEAMAGKELTESDILYLASITYWTAVSAKEELEIWKEYRKRFEDFLKTISDRVEEGIVSKNELLTTQVQLNEIDLQILQAEKTMEISKLNLKKLANIRVDQEVTLLDSIYIRRVVPDTTNVFEEAMQRRPEVKMLRQQVLAGEQMEKIIGARYAPSIGVSVGGNYSNGIIERPDGDIHYNIRATASLPIVRWGKKKNEKLVQQYYTQSAKERLLEQELDVQYDIAEAFYNLQQSVKQVTLSRTAAEEARENLRIYVDRYDEGLASIVEVTEAQTFLQNAIVSLFNYRTQYRFSLIEYDKALGRLN